MATAFISFTSAAADTGQLVAHMHRLFIPSRRGATCSYLHFIGFVYIEYQRLRT